MSPVENRASCEPFGVEYLDPVGIVVYGGGKYMDPITGRIMINGIPYMDP